MFYVEDLDKLFNCKRLSSATKLMNDLAGSSGQSKASTFHNSACVASKTSGVLDYLLKGDCKYRLGNGALLLLWCPKIHLQKFECMGAVHRITGHWM